MAFNITFNGTRMAEGWRRISNNNVSFMARATTQATREAAIDIEKRLRLDMASAGNFGKRWQESLTVVVTPRSGALLNTHIDVAHKIPYASIFETGGRISGKPLLWIPLSYTGFKGGPKDFPGRLFAVRRKSGRPLLLSLQDKLPKFFGIADVTIPKKFHFHTICGNVMKQFPARYEQLLIGLHSNG